MTAYGAPSDLDVYEVACLSGGTDRVVDTALVALVETGRVRVTAPGELATVCLVRRHPVEAAVLDAIGPAGHRSVETVRWRLTTDARILDVPRHLRDAGLLGGFAGGPAARRSRWRLAPTYAGRHLLHALRDCPPAEPTPGGSAMRVALQGREAMPDRELCRQIFEQPGPALAQGLRGRVPPALAFADGQPAAVRTRAEILKDAHFFGPGA
jgi:hypothetical protein